MRYILFKRLSIFVFFIFILNTTASLFGWYVMLPWYDNMMHFLGGAWLGMLGTWIFFYKIQRGSVNIATVLLFVFIGTICWELLEYFVQHIAQSPGALATIPDSISDVVFGMIGGYVSSKIYIRFIKKQ